MTTTEVAVRQQASAIPAKIAYAKALADSGLLPASYRKNPANVLWAVEFGDMIGISPMAAITGVHVIDGKPGASAGLISGLVRRAGHKLDVWGDGKSATCVITRSDAPRKPFTVTWTLSRNPDDNPSAEEAELLSKPVWQRYPASMLKARAITQCARDACEEVLFGLHYTPEELGADVDEDGVVVAEVVTEPAQQNEVDNGRPWAELALEEADTFKSEAAADSLFREAAARVLTGECTPGQATHIQNRITARVKLRRIHAMQLLLGQLAESDDWRAKVEGLADDTEARDALAELVALTPDQVDETRAGRISRAIIARFPKAAITDTEATA